MGLLIALVVPLLALGSGLTPAVASPAPLRDGPTIIVGREYALETPEVIPGPFVHIRFENAGREPHDLRLLRIEGGRGHEDVLDWQKTRGPLPAWLKSAGGIATLAPGEAAELRAVVPPGRYVILCGHPSPDGMPHAARGMFRLVTVLDRGSTATRLADATIVMRDDALALYGMPRAGEYAFLVQNEGTRPHQALVVRLPEGVSEAQELEWFRGGSRGVRPGHPVGGVIEILPGHEGRVTLQLVPGRYVVFCSIPVDGRRNFDRGMLARFEIQK